MALRLLILLLAVAFTGVAAASPAALAQGPPACDDGVDNDGDGDVDWYEDESCGDDPEGTSEGLPAVCRDALDNDGDGRVDREDPGCGGHAVGVDETDPPPVPSTLRFDTVRAYGCGIETAVEVLPDLTPARLFPFAELTIRVRGVAGRARGIDRTRVLPLGADRGYAFERLRPGRYTVVGRYAGDPFRLASAEVTRGVRISDRRCRAYFVGTDFRRRHKPRVLPIGASQRIYDVSWQRWGRRVARGTGTFPANDCTPYCVAGTITPYPVTVRLSRSRVCNGYLQFLTLRWTYRDGRPPGAQRTSRTTFDYNC